MDHPLNMRDLIPEEAWIKSASQWIDKIEFLDQVDSTNNQARQYLASGQVGQYLCVANQQSEGRGRLGRHWVSQPNINLYVSLLWVGASLNAGSNLAELNGLSLVVGLSITQVLKELGLTEAAIKWPNDIKLKDQKIAGILIELITAPSGALKVIIGFGLNIYAPSEPSGIDQPWTSLSKALPAACLSRSQILTQILDQLRLDLNQFVSTGWADFQDRWQENDALYGQEVVVVKGKEAVYGRACGVDYQGALKLLEVHSQEIRSLHAGEVRVRLMKSEQGAGSK